MKMSLPEEMGVPKFVFNWNLVLGLSAKQLRNSTAPFAMPACTRATLKGWVVVKFAISDFY